MELLRLALIGAITLETVLSMTATPAIAQMPFPSAANAPGPSSSLSGSPPYTCVTNYYVDAVNGNDSNPGTAAKPWQTIQNADWGSNVPTAGECVNIRPGTYNLNTSGSPNSPYGISLTNGGNSNSAAGYVVYRATVPVTSTPNVRVVMSTGANNPYSDLFGVGAPYIIFDGLEIDGNNAVTDGNGIDGCSASVHHLVVINNIIHGMGGGGIQTCYTDFVTIRNNLIYQTSSTSGYQESGISAYEPAALAAGSYTPTAWDNVTYGIQVSYNIVHDNLEGPSIGGDHTDGNGIIIDTTLGGSGGTPYPGKILVLGNLAYNNGGGGVHIFFSENVTVANNTCYNNYTDTSDTATDRGELSNGGSANIIFSNNIAIAVPGTGVLANNRPIVSFSGGSGYPDSGTFTRNITFGASNISDATSLVSASTNLVNVNPKLVNPAMDNFTLLPGSPAYRTGMPQSYLPSRTPDIGAY